MENKKRLNYERIAMIEAYHQHLKFIIDDNKLSDLELDVVKTGRNHKTNSHPKNTDIITYKYATGFEALIGYLYLNNKERLEELMNIIKEYICI